MNFASNSIRRAPLALAAVMAFGLSLGDAALATPASKVGERCTIHSGPYKGATGIYVPAEPGNGHGKVVCVLRMRLIR